MKKVHATTAAVVTAWSFLLGACGTAPKTALTPVDACKEALTQRVSANSTGFQINNAVTENDGTIRVYYQTTTEYQGHTISAERELAECKNGALTLTSQEAKDSSGTY
jgi:hypothetical protein